MRAANWLSPGVMAAFLLTSLAACSTRPAVPEYPDLPPAPQTVVINHFHLDRPDAMPERLDPTQELACPDHLPIDPATYEAGNDPLLRAWTQCKAAAKDERERRRSWENWEDREREAQRRSRVVGTEQAGT